MTTVDRLAKRCAVEQYPMCGTFEDHPEAYRNNARWWLRAIADELYKGTDDLPLILVGDWLREQAQEQDATGCRLPHGHAGKCEPYPKCLVCHRRRCHCVVPSEAQEPEMCEHKYAREALATLGEDSSVRCKCGTVLCGLPFEGKRVMTESPGRVMGEQEGEVFEANGAAMKEIRRLTQENARLNALIDDWADWSQRAKPFLAAALKERKL